MDRSITAAEEKKALRLWAREKLAGETEAQLRASDRALFAAFLALPQVQRADTLFLFWGIPGREPETQHLVHELTAMGKRVGLPRMLPGGGLEVRQFVPGLPMVSASFGIREPSLQAPLLAAEDIRLALIPAVCYDRQGFRLGFGGGYYDRWLARFSGETVGLCRECLLQQRLPREAHDLPVQTVLTEKRRITGGIEA